MKKNSVHDKDYYVVKVPKKIIKKDIITNKHFSQELTMYVSVIFLQNSTPIIKYNNNIFTCIHYTKEDAIRVIYLLKTMGLEGKPQQLTNEYRITAMSKTQKKLQSW